jgi:hypothetical protein
MYYLRSIKKYCLVCCGISSAGRAFGLHPKCRRFKSVIPHRMEGVAKVGSKRTFEIQLRWANKGMADLISMSYNEVQFLPSPPFMGVKRCSTAAKPKRTAVGPGFDTLHLHLRNTRCLQGTNMWTKWTRNRWLC